MPHAHHSPHPEQDDRPELTIGYVPGIMPGKWFGRWRERGLEPRLTEQQIGADAWREALDAGEVTACFVRLGWNPADPALDRLRETHHAILLYEELRVAVLGRDDVLTVLDTLTTAELTAETTPQQQPRLDDAALAVQLTAAGVGPVVLPMSVARLHARKDITFRELTDAPTVPVLLVWRKDLDEYTEAAVQRFVGIVRGRTSGSGRDGGAAGGGEGSDNPSPVPPTGNRTGGAGKRTATGGGRRSASGSGSRTSPDRGGRTSPGTRGAARTRAASAKNRRRRPR